MRLITPLLCLAVPLALAPPAMASGPATNGSSPVARAVWSAMRAPDLAARPAASRASARRPAPWRPRSDAYMTPAVLSTPSVMLAPPNDQCAGAITIPCGNITLSGTTFGAADDYHPDSAQSCTHYPAAGADMVYKLTAQVGDSLWVNYTSLADGSIYLVTDCSNVNGTCKAGADQNRSAETEHLEYKFTLAGTYYLILDNYGQDNSGSWTLNGQFLSCGLSLPHNDVCQNASIIGCGVFFFNGSTATATNDYQFSSLGASCGTNSLAQGGDVVYQMSVSAGDSLSATVSSTADAVMYLFSTCGSAPNTCETGVNATGVGGSETIHFKFQFNGTYYLVIDSNGAGSSGTFTLSGELVCMQPVPQNDVCATAFSLSCGTIDETGDTENATRDYSLTNAGCTGFPSDGPDVVYRIDAKHGDSLWVDYRFPPPNPQDPSSGADAVIYLVSYCGNVDYGCVAGRDNTGSGQTEHLTYKFNVPGPYWLILDSYDSQFGGEWTLQGALICAPPTAVDWPPGGAEFRMSQAIPNPFAASSTVRYTLPSRGPVLLRVYDLAGRVVRTLAYGMREAGDHSVTWNARDDNGTLVGAGTYFARLVYGDHVAYRTMIFVH